jgi:hypothetical protein
MIDEEYEVVNDSDPKVNGQFVPPEWQQNAVNIAGVWVQKEGKVIYNGGIVDPI